MARVLSGTQIRDRILEECRSRVEELKQNFRSPGLAVVLVGDDPASEIYVRHKTEACIGLGMLSEKITPPAATSTAELLSVLDQLNHRPEIDGILVQMPLPPQIDSRQILLAIDPAKDVDGFHPVSVGNLVANRPGPRPCTPAGIIEMLKRYEIPIAGKHAVVVGRSDIVGKPMAMLLLHENATVTICHSRTQDLAAVCRSADILIAAIGRPAFLTEEHIGEGAVVVDVGINRLTTREEAERIFRDSEKKMAAFQKRGSVIVGDVDPVAMEQLSSAYTPVPGGVGPLTIAMLMSNTIDLAERAKQCSESG